MQDKSDAELVEEALAGSPAAWEEIVRRYSQRLFALALRITNNRVDAEEVVQNTLVIALRKLRALRDTSKLFAWLARTARNEALLILRKRRGRRIGDREDIDIESGDDSPEDALLRTQRIKDVRDCVNRLPAKQREIMEVRLYQSLTLQDIADMMDMPLGTAKGRERLGLTKVRNCLESKGYGYNHEN